MTAARKKFSGIYKITNPKRRVYIGQSKDVLGRFVAYQNLRCADQPKLYNSLVKHGVDKHEFEIICTCNDDELDKLEIYYIELYNSISKGMNCKSGGNRPTLSAESREKLRQSLLIANKNPLTKERRSAWQRGRKMSPEAIEKCRAAKIGKPLHPNLIKRITGNNFACKGSVHSFKGGVFVGEYKNAMEAGRQLKICQQNINKVIKGERPHAMGYTFKRVA